MRASPGALRRDGERFALLREGSRRSGERESSRGVDDGGQSQGQRGLRLWMLGADDTRYDGSQLLSVSCGEAESPQASGAETVGAGSEGSVWLVRGRRSLAAWNLAHREYAEKAKSRAEARLGAGDGIRTRDNRLGKPALYQLSYSRVHCPLHSIASRGALVQRGCRTAWDREVRRHMSKPQRGRVALWPRSAARALDRLLPDRWCGGSRVLGEPVLTVARHSRQAHHHS